MSYTPTTWAAGDTVTAAKLNKLEQGVASGGGALRVNMTYEGSDAVLDKTWEEIVEAIEGGVLPYVYNGTEGSLGNIFYINGYEDTGTRYDISIRENDGTSTIYTASSKTGYPTHSDGGGVY